MDLLDREPWQNVFSVAASLPKRLDPILSETAPDVMCADPAGFIEWAAGRSIVTSLQACSLLLANSHIERNVSEQLLWSAVQKYIENLEEVQAEINVAAWFSGEILRRPETFDWSRDERAAVSWIHGALTLGALS